MDGHGGPARHAGRCHSPAERSCEQGADADGFEEASHGLWRGAFGRDTRGVRRVHPKRIQEMGHGRRQDEPAERVAAMSANAMTKDARPLHPRGEATAKFVAAARTMSIPPDVLDAAKKALVDFIGVAIGARDEPLAGALTRTVAGWNASGNAFIILGQRTTPALAALVNGTLVHAVEYDDQHPNGSGHPSAPCWSAALAVAAHHGLSEHETLAAFVAGYEITAKLGGGGPEGVGRTLQTRGFHPTSVFGRMGAAGA